MYEPQFTPRVQELLALAMKEARRLKHSYVGSEHLLLGLIELGKKAPECSLPRIGIDVDPDELKGLLEKHYPYARESIGSVGMPYTPRLKQILVMAGKEAKLAQTNYVGLRHIVLGILAVGTGASAVILFSKGVTLEGYRNFTKPQCLDAHCNSQEIADGEYIRGVLAENPPKDDIDRAADKLWQKSGAAGFKLSNHTFREAFAQIVDLELNEVVTLKEIIRLKDGRTAELRSANAHLRDENRRLKQKRPFNISPDTGDDSLLNARRLRADLELQRQYSEALKREHDRYKEVAERLQELIDVHNVYMGLRKATEEAAPHAEWKSGTPVEDGSIVDIREVTGPDHIANKTYERNACPLTPSAEQTGWQSGAPVGEHRELFRIKVATGGEYVAVYEAKWVNNSHLQMMHFKTLPAARRPRQPLRPRMNTSSLWNGLSL